MRMVQAALKLHPDSREKIKDRDVLLVDDNGTDWVTYIWARNLFFEAGARSVGIVTLTNTIRNTADLII
ncbi:MAG: hypothetical protein HQM15_06285 [Deltaproteobacteria bacterium]|nr:hypothetical protein [Deltaproteobacteria bacterium]